MRCMKSRIAVLSCRTELSPPDNNRAEDAPRPVAAGRKNRRFSNTANGAEASAILYSIAAAVQANRLTFEVSLFL